MTDNMLKSYRLSSMKEPSDAMLDCIMQKAVDDANDRYEQALNRYFQEIKTLIASRKAEWAEKYGVVLDA